MGVSIKRHYHWIIAAIVLLEMLVYVGILNNIFGLYVVPVSESLGITRGDYSLAFSVRSMVGALSIVVSGPLLRRVGYRKIVAFFLLLAVAAFLILSASQNLVMVYVGTILIGFCDGSCLTTGASFIIDNWFHRYHGSVFGLVTAASGIGGSMMCALLSGIINTAGWRISLVTCGLLTAVVAIVISFFIRDYPRQIGQKPLGEGERIKEKKAKKEDDHWHGYTMQKLLKMPVFYLAILEIFLSCFCTYVAFYVIVPYLQSRGLSASDAAVMQSVMLLSMAAYKLLSGVLCDWIGAKKATGICLVALVAGLWLLIKVNTYTSAMAAILVYSLALPMTTVIIPLFTASLFGYNTHNATLGIFLAMPSAGSIIAAPVANMIFDRLGTYLPAFYGVWIISVVVLLLHILVCILTLRSRKKLETILL